MTKLDYLFKQHESVLGWYKQSEEKANFLLTLNTVVVGVVNGLVFIGAERVRAVGMLYPTAIWTLLVLSGLALLGSYAFVLFALWPRQGTRDAKLARSERLWFFGDVASMKREEYGAAVDEWTEQDLERSMTAQNYILSKNVLTKHEALNRAILCSIIALMLLFALGVAYGIAVAHGSLPRPSDAQLPS